MYYILIVTDNNLNLGIMTKKDLELIEKAKHASDFNKPHDYENEAETEEAREKIHDIATFEYHLEEYNAGLL